MSAQGWGVRLTATTVPDDQTRPSDGPALLHEHSGSGSRRAPTGLCSSTVRYRKCVNGIRSNPMNQKLSEARAKQQLWSVRGLYRWT